MARKIPNRSDIAYEYVSELLCSGRFRPGEAINVTELSQALDMSRQPVMSALQRLSNEEMVQIIPQVGCIAATYSYDDWHDFHRLFAAGEGLIAEIATERGTDEEIRKLRSLENAVRKLESPKLSQLDRASQYRTRISALYEHLHRMARSPTLDRQMHAMWNRASYHFYAVASGKMATDRLVAAMGRMDAICEAIENRRAKTAARLVEQHILKQFEASERLLD